MLIKLWISVYRTVSALLGELEAEGAVPCLLCASLGFPTYWLETVIVVGPAVNTFIMMLEKCYNLVWMADTFKLHECVNSPTVFTRLFDVQKERQTVTVLNASLLFLKGKDNTFVFLGDCW